MLTLNRDKTGITKSS